MALFQKNVLKKHLSLLDKGLVTEAYERYQSYFLNSEIQSNIRSSKEEQFQEGFLRELFVKVLGYTLNPSPNFNLITEQKNENNAKKADGAILVNGNVVGVIELKDGKTTDLSKVEQQAFGYKSQNKNATYVIISNFEKLRFYIDNAVEYYEFDLFHLTENEFAILYLLLAYPQIERNIPKHIKEESLSREDAVTKALYKDYSEFKRELFADILEHNKVDTTEEKVVLFKKTQKLLDRLLFIFFAEDSLLLTPNTMIRIISDWEKLKELDEYKPLYERIKKYFDWLNYGHKGKDFEVFAYNGGLFKNDDVLDSLTISDDVLLTHTRKLSEYDYASEVDVNILGHIFENSLTEIEEITNQLKEGASPAISKRKKDGVFYTPQYVTKYIVENTIGKLCCDKKAEFGIVESEYFSDKKRQIATKKSLLDKLENYRDWLKNITICDPACGSGAFLSAALLFLKKEHELINEMQAKVTGGGIAFAYFENDILENNLYGVDINEESVEIAKLSLWLRTAQPNRKLSSLNNNIKCGNSLVSDPSIAGDKAFNWEQEFPEVFTRGGFDIVIGNPPYVTRGLTHEIKDYINNNFQTAEYQVDLYVSFMEKAVLITKNGGYNSFIVPNSWLKNLRMSKCREFMLNALNLLSIVRTNNVFEDASVDTLIYIGMKSENIMPNIAISDFENGEVVLKHYSSKERFYKNNSLIFDIEVNDVMANILEKMRINVSKINELFDVCRGINPYDKYTGQAPEIISTRAYHADYKKDETFVPELKGRHINRYSDFWDGHSYISYGEWLAAPRELKYFTGERIVFREILGKTLISTILTEDFKIDRSLYIALPLNDSVDIYYVDGILNSQLMSTYFRFANNEFDNLFPKMRVAEFRELPIKNTNKEEQIIMADRVKQMLSLNKDLQTKRNRFYRRLKDNFEDIKITGALETFDLLEFKEFIRELGKQKIKLSLVQQDEWEEYFEKYKSECNAISEQISTTDKKIDRLVYQLYNLTEDEIAMIEQG